MNRERKEMRHKITKALIELAKLFIGGFIQEYEMG
jgi:hypothetical protein